MAKRTHQKFILLIGEEGAILTHLDGGKVVRRLFAAGPDATSMKPFLDAFAEHPGVPLQLLVDVMDQSYLQQVLPPVSAMSVNKLVKRRLERDFSDQDITGALRIGKDANGRKDWEYLFVSLADSPPFSKWMEALSDLPNRCQGIYLLPIESQRLMQRLATIVSTEKGAAASKWQLLVCHNKVGGFRQVVLRDGKLAFTRLTQSISNSSQEVIAGNIEQEIVNTAEYLKRLGFNPADGLDIFVIAAREIVNTLELHNVETRFFKSMTPLEAASKLGITDAVQEEDRFADTVLATYFGQSSRGILRLMTKYLRKLDQLYQIRLGYKATLGVVVPLLLVWAGINFWNSLGLQNTLAEQQTRKEQLEKDINAAMQRQAVLPEDFIMMSDMIELHEVISQYSRSPLPDVKKFADAMRQGMLASLIEWRQIPTNGKNKEITDISVTLDIQVENSKASYFANSVKKLTERLGDSFPGYEINHSKIPGVIDEDEQLDITFDSSQSGQRLQLTPGEIIPVTLSLSNSVQVKAGGK